MQDIFNQCTDDNHRKPILILKAPYINLGQTVAGVVFVKRSGAIILTSWFRQAFSCDRLWAPLHHHSVVSFGHRGSPRLRWFGNGTGTFPRKLKGKGFRRFSRVCSLFFAHTRVFLRFNLIYP